MRDENVGGGSDSNAVWGKPWLTKKELAKYLGFSQRFIDTHVRPFLHVFKPNPGFGTKILFSRDEVDRFIESKRVDTLLE